MVSANRQCCAASGKPGIPFGQGDPMCDKCLQNVIGLPVCSERNGISVGGGGGREQWAQVLFSDESRFNLSHHDCRIRVFRRRGERFADNCLIERDQYGGGSVMVWGGIMDRRKTNLTVVQGNLNPQDYINQILQPEAVPFLQRHGHAILMHDNARPHVARIIMSTVSKQK